MAFRRIYGYIYKDNTARLVRLWNFYGFTVFKDKYGHG